MAMAKSKKKKWFKWVAITVAAVVVVGGGTTAFVVANSMKASDSTTTLVKQTAQTGTISNSVSGSGTVSNSDQYSLTAAGSGEVDNVYVKQGDTVKAGQVIAHINDTNAEETILQKQSSLANAKNNLLQAQNQLNSLYIKTPTAGRVKSVTPSAGDDLSTLKSLGNNLALISTARSMSVSISSPEQSVKSGDAVKVYSEAGSLIANGTVTSAGASSGGASGMSGNSIAVKIPTDTPAVNTEVIVKTGDGKEIGSGSLQLTNYIAISSQGSGTISNVYVSENQMVNKNDSLFKLNDASVQNQIAQAQNSLKLAEDDLANAQTSIDEETIKSPVDGIVAELDVKKGDNVSANGSIATIINPNLMQTVVSVDELDISKIKVGQDATVTLDAITSQTFNGSVTQIDEIGSASNGVTTYSVTVSIENPTGVKVGMTTNANIITSSKSDVVVVNTSSVLEKRGTTGYILMAKGLMADNVRREVMKNADMQELIKKYGKQVTIGMVSSNQYEITDGLNAGDEYVTAVTISKSAVASLSNTSNNSLMGSFGGMNGFGFSGNYRRSTTNGNTTGGSTNKSTTGGTTTGNTTGGGTNDGNKNQ